MISKKGLVVILIDMQRHFLKLISDTKTLKIVAKQKQMIEFCIVNDIPLITLEYNDAGETIPELKEQTKSVPRNIVIIKPDNDGFIYTNLHEKLKEMKAETLLLMGVYAEACVLATAMGAVKRKYKVITCKELMDGAANSLDRNFFRAVQWYKKNGKLFGKTSTLIKKIQ